MLCIYKYIYTYYEGSDVRKIISLTIDEDQHRSLKTEAARRGVKMYEIVAEALEAYGIGKDERQGNEKNCDSKQ